MFTIIDANLAFVEKYSLRIGPPKGIVLHHAAADASVEEINAWHLANDWAGIGYHFYVRKDGSIYYGRPENWLGAHTVGFNDRIGICAEGNFENDVMGEIQKQALIWLISYLTKKYGSLPITAHRDHDATACPGTNYPFDEIVHGKLPEHIQTESPKENIVLAFQKAALADGLPLPQYGDDGIWGEETADAASVVLVFGSQGERVRLLQRLLIEQGYDLGVHGADGIFGAKTLDAVKEFQCDHYLESDGIVGILTWMALLCIN